MNAVDYLKAREQMTGDCFDEQSCEKCPFHKHNNIHGVDCTVFESCHPDTAVGIVKAWAEKNGYYRNTESDIDPTDMNMTVDELKAEISNLDSFIATTQAPYLKRYLERQRRRLQAVLNGRTQ